MGVWTKFSVLILVVAIAWRFTKETPKPNLGQLGRGSFVAKGWETVEHEFRHQLKSGLLKGGAFAVYHKGKPVVDLSGGDADGAACKLWDNQTMSVYFSTTKGVASVVMAMLVDRGLLDYKKPVSSYWPEFAQNGKKDITVEQLISHQTGLITVNDGDYSVSDLQSDPQKWKKDLAAAKLYWQPGSKLGYHALTKGFYEDELLKILDPKHRSMKQFFQEEIADVYGIDFYIGVPKEIFYRVARIAPPPFYSLEVLMDPSIWSFFWNWHSGFNSLFVKSFSFAEWGTGFWNNPYFMELSCPATHGVGTASSLAKFFGILANGGEHEGKTLLSEKLIEKLGEPVVSGIDAVLNVNWTIGPGTMIMSSANGGHLFGTPGYGGQNAYADPKNQLGVAYLSNHLSHYIHTDPRFVGLMAAVYETLKHFDN